jgi:hypothetical protein
MAFRLPCSAERLFVALVACLGCLATVEYEFLMQAIRIGLVRLVAFCRPAGVASPICTFTV